MVFKISSETRKVKFAYGYYNVFITGGFYIEVNPAFKLNIINTVTNERVDLYEQILFKERLYKYGKRGVLYYAFKIEKEGIYDITLHNFEDMIVKKSMLGIRILFQNPVKLDMIEIVIESKPGWSGKTTPLES